MRQDLPRAAVVGGILVLSQLSWAQTTIIGATGTIYRYHGDTIWDERDTTVMRTIIRGDTVATLYSINGVMRYDLTHVVRGDSGRLIDARYGAGFDRPPETVGKSTPAGGLLIYHSMFANEWRTAPMRARTSTLMYDREPPRSPEPARTYDVSAELKIIHHRDTVFFVRGCPAFGRVDTTVFLLVGQDSVRRVSRPERTFGQAMYLSLTQHMRSTLTRERINSRQTPLPADFPKAPGGCP